MLLLLLLLSDLDELKNFPSSRQIYRISVCVIPMCLYALPAMSGCAVAQIWGISSQTWISASAKSVGRFWSARQPHQCLCHPRNVYIFYIFQPSVSVLPYLEKPRVAGTSRWSDWWMPLHCKRMANGGLDATPMESVFHRFGRKCILVACWRSLNSIQAVVFLFFLP